MEYIKASYLDLQFIFLKKRNYHKRDLKIIILINHITVGYKEV